MTRYRNERGAALLETAITIPMLLLICVGIFEFGHAYQTWQVLTNASREGARMACLEGPTDADVRNRVNDYLELGKLPRLPPEAITIDRTVTLTASATGASVEVIYPFDFMVLNKVVNLVTKGSAVGKPIEMKAKAVMRNE